MRIDHKQFFDGYKSKFGRLTQVQTSALESLLTFIEADQELEDLRHVAYILATIRHETAGTYLPIEEYGKGRGKAYGIKDKQTGQTYYGRGFVQLTWRKNYQKLSDLLMIDLVANPSLALEPDIAWQITSLGMREGLFTGKSLNDYIQDDECDYQEARRIINKLDKAALIAGYAESFEAILRSAEIADAIQQPSAANALASPSQTAELSLDAPQQTNEAGAAGVIIQPNALQSEAAKPIVSSPGDPPIEATTGGVKSMVASAVGWITGAGAGLVALLKDNQTLLIIAAVIAVIAGLAYFIRQLILDRDRLRIAADPTKWNAK